MASVKTKRGKLTTKNGRATERKKRVQWAPIVALVESMVGDDLCEELDMSNAYRSFRGDKKVMHEKLSAIYRLVHSFNPNHECHHVHKNWRDEFKPLLTNEVKSEATTK